MCSPYLATIFPSFLINSSTMSSLFCLSRPQLGSDGLPLYSHDNHESYIDEKRFNVLDEDEMQQRLSDLRREISDAKVDW
jgi:hypothetical protein